VHLLFCKKTELHIALLFYIVLKRKHIKYLWWFVANKQEVILWVTNFEWGTNLIHVIISRDAKASSQIWVQRMCHSVKMCEFLTHSRWFIYLFNGNLSQWFGRHQVARLGVIRGFDDVGASNYKVYNIYGRAVILCSRFASELWMSWI
jgi:hypothetical protein